MDLQRAEPEGGEDLDLRFGMRKAFREEMRAQDDHSAGRESHKRPLREGTLAQDDDYAVGKPRKRHRTAATETQAFRGAERAVHVGGEREKRAGCSAGETAREVEGFT